MFPTGTAGAALFLLRISVAATLVVDGIAHWAPVTSLGVIPARRLLIIGLGDLESFTPDREQLIGTIVFQESSRLGVAHPFFAPTVLDGGKTGMDTGDTAEQFVRGFLRAKAVDDLLQSKGVSSGSAPIRLTFLAGAEHAQSTRTGLARGLATAQSQ